jgi:hypothetical protein
MLPSILAFSVAGAKIVILTTEYGQDELPNETADKPGMELTIAVSLLMVASELNCRDDSWSAWPPLGSSKAKVEVRAKERREAATAMAQSRRFIRMLVSDESQKRMCFNTSLAMTVWQRYDVWIKGGLMVRM